MLRRIFGDTRDGRLNRLEFLGGMAVLLLVGAVATLGVLLALGIPLDSLAGETPPDEEILAEGFSGTAALALLMLALTLLMGQLNLWAKRFRDIGLAGWWSVLAAVLVCALVGQLVSEAAGSALNFAIFLALVLIPGSVVGPTRSPTST